MSSELIVPPTPRGAASTSETAPITEIVALKISYEIPEQILSENELDQSHIRITYCFPSDTLVQQVKKQFISHLLAKGVVNLEVSNKNDVDSNTLDQFRLLVTGGKELLVDKKSLQENRIENNGKPLSVNLIKISNNPSETDDENVVNLSDYVERETIKIKKKHVEVKLRIQEKVGDQVLTCDISCKNNKKFGVISKMYCQHRNYNAEDFVFATSVNHVLLKNEKSLSSMGMVEQGTVYVINVYHKDLVSFK
ncbi:predicted protein [Naegleria gruberi]|uniref:Predicted protein n=1 Tax=Naegleria gruberi TaxID=5762 RepID=D2VVT2_NAEGR|nr:uncharacterized protein NAEGRDRAFT_73131 [Naegleria gruberi]EFC39094.1 predicted protein [Naegleria gruberi]|eukprot:XP_002671838.1 predicted protein [Naegleria gruberi strain NEG-M]